MLKSKFAAFCVMAVGFVISSSAYAVIDPAVDAAITELQTDGASMGSKFIPLTITVITAGVILKWIKRFSSKAT